MNSGMYNIIHQLESYDLDTNAYLANKKEQDAANNARSMITRALEKHIENIDTDDCEAGEEDAFFVADLGEVHRQHMRWVKNLPQVTPHYAVKCNPDPEVLRLLNKLGAGFDCASKAEIEQVLALGVNPSRIIYAQPCKTKSYLRYTVASGVSQMTFDNADELYKVKAIYPTAELFLRISTDDSASLCRLSQKFGAAMDDVPALLSLAKALGLNLVGVAFHVGSGASDPKAFHAAVKDARDVFDQAKIMGFDMHTLDCGGGFISETFDKMSGALSDALKEYFPTQVRLIAEPGRFYTANAFTLACNVIARRTVEDKHNGGDSSYMLYLNDGVYGNFSSIIFDHQHPIPKVLRTYHRVGGEEVYSTSGDRFNDSGYNSCAEEDCGGKGGGKPITYSVWGPTCDGIDLIAEKWNSRKLVDVGDWLYFENMGSYTKCSATRFNGFTDKHATIYVCSDASAALLLGM